MKAKKKTERPMRIDFNIYTREIVEVYEISPDGRKVRTDEGWVSAYMEGVITQRPPHVPGFVTKEQIEYAIQAERDILKDKRYKDRAEYIIAKKYPIKEWLKENRNV